MPNIPQDSGAAGLSLAPRLHWMIDEYYRLMKWDTKTGVSLECILVLVQ